MPAGGGGHCCHPQRGPTPVTHSCQWAVAPCGDVSCPFGRVWCENRVNKGQQISCTAPFRALTELTVWRAAATSQTEPFWSRRSSWQVPALGLQVGQSQDAVREWCPARRFRNV